MIPFTVDYGRYDEGRALVAPFFVTASDSELGFRAREAAPAQDACFNGKSVCAFFLLDVHPYAHIIRRITEDEPMTATAHHTTAESTRAAILDMERSPWTGRLRLRDCIELYGNEDAVGGDYAFKAFCEGRSAFWSTCRGNNQVALCLRDSANLMSTLENALTTIPAHRQHWMADYLATLVPLNHRAAHELSEAYARIGEWRDVEELEVRRLRDLGRAA